MKNGYRHGAKTNGITVFFVALMLLSHGTLDFAATRHQMLKHNIRLTLLSKRHPLILGLESTTHTHPRVFTLHQPERIVIDLSNASIDNSLRSVTNGAHLIKNIRIGHPNSTGLRVVLEMKKPVTFIVKPWQRGWRLIVNPTYHAPSKTHYSPPYHTIKTSPTVVYRAKGHRRPKVNRSRSPKHVSTWLSHYHTIHPKASIQLGGFFVNQGKDQHVNVSGIIGDSYSVSQKNDANGLIGLGFYFDGLQNEHVTLSYGINAFYLPKTNVNGLVTQENTFTNMSYEYSRTNYPIYAAAKTILNHTYSERYQAVLDAGLGVNIIRTSDVNQTALTSYTVPDQLFSGKTTSAFSAMVGIGVQMNQVFGQVPLECGYRFLYLGQGDFNRMNPQVLTTLDTGSAYANALFCSIRFSALGFGFDTDAK